MKNTIHDICMKTERKKKQVHCAWSSPAHLFASSAEMESWKNSPRMCRPEAVAAGKAVNCTYTRSQIKKISKVQILVHLYRRELIIFC